MLFKKVIQTYKSEETLSLSVCRFTVVDAFYHMFDVLFYLDCMH